MWCCVMQCVAVCCSVLQCVAVCCSVLQCIAVCCSVLQCVAMCCSVLQCVLFDTHMCVSSMTGETASSELIETMRAKTPRHARLEQNEALAPNGGDNKSSHKSRSASQASARSARTQVCYSVLQFVAVCGSVWQCVAVCGSVWQCVAVCCSVLQRVVACCNVLQCVTLIMRHKKEKKTRTEHR